MEETRKNIYRQVASGNLSKKDAKKLLMELADSKKKTEVAIIGMSCRYPKAENMDEYWDNIFKMRSCLGYPSEERVELWKKSYPEYFEGKKEVKELFEYRGYIENVEKFDANFFHLSAKEAQFMEPSHRIFMETAFEAIENAGIGGENIKGTKTAIFVGMDNQSSHGFAAITDRTDPLALTGLYPSLIATRLSYMLNLKGESLVIDTACSSGLVAVHKACQAIEAGECEMAMAGGIYISDNVFRQDDDPMMMICTENDKIMAFDNRGEGTIRSEGVGVVFLKPYEQALKDGDNIYAVIKGGAINNDGASNGITAPNAEAQAELLVEAWEKAGVNPETIAYIESHGTGTLLGDPIEIKGLTSAFRKYTDKKQFCAISAVKPNIGHTASSSGVAGLIKMVLAMQHKVIPGTINFEIPNAYISFDDSPVYVSDRPTEWKKNGKQPRRGGVSAFGFNGTNCHIVLEEAPAVKKADTNKEEWKVFTLSAMTEQSLTKLCKRYRTLINTSDTLNIDALCQTLNCVGGQYNYRLAVLVRSMSGLRIKLEQICNQGWREAKGIFYGFHSIVSSKKDDKAEGELAEEEKLLLTRQLDDLIREQKDIFYSYDSLVRLLEKYIKGGNVNWLAVYKEKKCNKVHLLPYPFEQNTYWPSLEDNGGNRIESKKKGRKTIYPLCGTCVSESIHEDVYAAQLSVSDYWFLQEHNILGQYLVPGTVYIEFMYQIAGNYHTGSQIECEDIAFWQPFIVKENEVKELQIPVSRNDNGLEFTFASRDTDSESKEWQKHAEAKVHFLEEKERRAVSIDTYIQRCGKKVEKASKNQIVSLRSQASLGGRWTDTIEDIFLGEEEVLVKISLLEKYQSDIVNFKLHPAMLDNAMNSIIQSMNSHMYLPFSYGSLKLYQELPKTFYSHLVRMKKENASDEVVTFSGELIDENGNVIAQVQNYRVKKVNKQQFLSSNRMDALCHEVVWREESREESKAASVMPTIFVSAAGHRSDGLLDSLAAKGVPVFRMEAGGNYDVILGGMKNNKQLRIVYDITGVQDAPICEQKINQKVLELFHMVKALFRQNMAKGIELVILSECAYQMTGKETGIYPENAAVLGLARTISAEYPGINCWGMDVDANTGYNMILEELLQEGNQGVIGYRENRRHCEYIEPVSSKETKEFKLRENGTYLITGGLGGIGVQVAKYLLSNHAGNVVLLGRMELPDKEDMIGNENDVDHILEKKKALKELELIAKPEQKVVYYKADVTSYKQMSYCLEDIRKQYGKIAGIVHSAGLGSKGYLAQKEEDKFTEVLKPKMLGTHILDELTKDDKLDWMLLFSSAMSISGGIGQGDYTAANSYLDSYAQSRKLLGKRTIVINWTSWRETGMAVRFKSEEGILMGIMNQEAVEVLDFALHHDYVRLVAGKIDYEKLASIEKMPIRLAPELFKKTNAFQMGTGEGEARKTSGTQFQIKGKKKGNYTENERIIAGIWAEVLGLNQIDIYTSLFRIGGDSIISTKLLKRYQKEFGNILDITDIFTYPTVFELSEYVTSIQKKDKKAQEKAQEKLNEDFEDISQIMDGIEKGEVSVDNALEYVNRLL